MYARIPIQRSLAGLGILLGLLAIPVANASAAGPTFSLKPASPAPLGYFVLKGKPGGTVRGKVEVLNVGSKAGTTNLYAVDATTGETSGAVYRSKGEPRRDVGRWISISSQTLSLGPGESRIVSFAVHVPDDAKPGQHLGGLVAQRSSSTVKGGSKEGGKGNGKENSFKIKINALSVLAVQVDLPGPERPKMALSGIEAGNQPGHQSILLGIGNTGNVLVKGAGSVKVATRSGRQVLKQSFNLDTFVPQTHIDFPVYVEGKALRTGRYRGTVTVNYEGRSLTRSFPFTISKEDTRQVFGTNAANLASASSGGGGDSTALVILAVVAAASIGAAAFFYLRNRGVV
jgi:hypothetical protein